jgi:hypothetical protein
VRARDQLIVAAVLAAATYVSLLRIAEAKNEAAVGGGVYPLDAHHPAELDAFAGLRSQIARMGDPALADRLETLRDAGEIWVAPRLGPERWGVFAATGPLVHRIYLRREALLDPVTHLYRGARPDIPAAYKQAHAWISLAGTLRHEVAHRDGVRSEAAAYAIELGWYEGLRSSPFLAGLEREERQAWTWGLESAVLSARKARDTVAGISAAAAAAPSR